MNFPIPEEYCREKFFQFVEYVQGRATNILKDNGLWSVSISFMIDCVDVSENIVSVPFVLNGTKEENQQALNILMPRMKNAIRCHNGFIVSGNYMEEDPKIF